MINSTYKNIYIFKPITAPICSLRFDNILFINSIDLGNSQYFTELNGYFIIVNNIIIKNHTLISGNQMYLFSFGFVYIDNILIINSFIN